jgi:sucrose phosphorylase
VLRTRNLPLLHDYPACDGTRWLWTTFSRDQVDLNFANPEVLLEIVDVLLGYAAHGAAMLRLDAIPYLWKKLGTSCAHLPETHEIIKLVRDVFDAAAPHVLLLTETNVPHSENISYVGDHGDEAQMIYNFPLAPLIVWSFYKSNAEGLTKWAKQVKFISPRATYLNITATHDGIGMRPTEGILNEDERLELVHLAYDRQGNMTGKRNPNGSVAPYELNLSYFDAINDPLHPEPMEMEARKFLASQAIPMAMIGIPGIYIHSLLGSRNALDEVQRTQRARSINRAQLPLPGLEAELDTPGSLRKLVFDGMRRLLEIRSKQSAFHPNARQEVLSLHPAVFALRRFNPETGQEIFALHNVSSSELSVPIPACSGRALRDLLCEEIFPTSATTLSLAPYQVRWLHASL